MVRDPPARYCNASESAAAARWLIAVSDDPGKRNASRKTLIAIAGHRTSVSLEDAFWKGLKESAGVRRMTLSKLVASIDSERRHGNLSSAIRLFVLDFYRDKISSSAGQPGKERLSPASSAPQRPLAS
jgi:predicted DNA-binding ribbon-helix-helix protein